MNARLSFAVAVLAGVAGLAAAQDDEAGWADEIRLAEVDLPADGAEVTVPFILHLWDLTETVEGDEPRGRTITLRITPPRGIGAVDVRHAPWSDDGSAADSAFVRSPEITYAADETAREVRVTFKRTGGAIAGDLVVVARAVDPKVLPQERRIVIPLKRDRDAPTPEGDVGLFMARPNDEGGYDQERPSATTAHPWTTWRAYLLVPWERPGARVTGTVTGGFPPVEVDLAPPNAPRRHSRGLPFYFEGTYIIDLGLSLTYAVGDLVITGELRAEDGSTKSFDETLRYHPNPHRRAHGTLTWSKRDGTMSGFVDLEPVQSGGRWAKVRGGGATRYAWIGGTRALVSLPAPTGPITSIEVTFIDFGRSTTLPVEIDELKRDDRDPPAVDADDLARAQRSLDGARDAHARAYALHAISECYAIRRSTDPTWLSKAREAYDAIERALPERPDWREATLRAIVSWLEIDIMRAIEAGEVDLARAWIRRAEEAGREIGRGPAKWVWPKYAHGLMELTGDLDEARALWKKGSDSEYIRSPGEMFRE